jgi:hypothetical protein
MSKKVDQLTENDCREIINKLNSWSFYMEFIYSIFIFSCAVVCLSFENYKLLAVTVTSLMMIVSMGIRLSAIIPVALPQQFEKLTIDSREEEQHYKLKEAISRTYVHAYNIAYLFYALVLFWNVYRYMLGPFLQGLF